MLSHLRRKSISVHRLRSTIRSHRSYYTDPLIIPDKFSVTPLEPGGVFRRPFLRFAQEGDKVLVEYRCYTPNGVVVDSTERRGKPSEFYIGQTHHIPVGLDRALQLIPVGQKAKVIVPYDEAFGARGLPGWVSPYSTVYYDIELLQIMGKTRQQFSLLKTLYNVPHAKA